MSVIVGVVPIAMTERDKCPCLHCCYSKQSSSVESTTLAIVLITRAISCTLLAEWAREGELEERRGGKLTGGHSYLCPGLAYSFSIQEYFFDYMIQCISLNNLLCFVGR